MQYINAGIKTINLKSAKVKRWSKKLQLNKMYGLPSFSIKSNCTYCTCMCTLIQMFQLREHLPRQILDMMQRNNMNFKAVVDPNTKCSDDYVYEFGVTTRLYKCSHFQSCRYTNRFCNTRNVGSRIIVIFNMCAGVHFGLSDLRFKAATIDCFHC